MTYILVLGTQKGAVLCEKKDDRWIEAHRTMGSRQVTALAAQNGIILAGTVEGIFASEDLGLRWKPANNGLTSKHIRSLANYPLAPELAFAGTEPAGIFVSYEAGHIWRACPEISQMRERYDWQLPYSPQAGCVRDFAFHGQRAYAAVEDGGVLVSFNAGENWQMAEGSQGKRDHNPGQGAVHSDVHSIEVHPSSPDLVFAATGGGLFRSEDGGKQWELLYRCYCRAVWIAPDDPNHIILGPADGVDRNGRIELSREGGKTWVPGAQGLEVPWENHMVERFVQVDSELMALLSNGELWSRQMPQLKWQRVMEQVKGIRAVAGMAAPGMAVP